MTFKKQNASYFQGVIVEERIIIKSELSNVVKKLCRWILFAGIAFWLIVIGPSALGVLFTFISDIFSGDMPGLLEAFTAIPVMLIFFLLSFAVFGGGEGILISRFVWYAYGKSELTVTDKRVYGKAMFGKRVDIPLDSISAVGTSSLLKGVSVSSSSGRLVFTGIENKDEIHQAISELLLERQAKNKSNQQTIVKQEVSQSNADELKKYKDLLDSGIISQDEFDAKKKQLLNL